MTLNFSFSVSSYLLILLGLIGLALTSELSWIYLLAAAASLAASGLGEIRRGKGFLPTPWANAVMVVIFVVVLASIVLLKTLPLQELAHFLLALQSVKLLSVKRGRDWLQLYLLSFFSLIAATALSIEISTAVIFALYLIWGPWVLVLFQLCNARVPLAKSAEAGGPWPILPLFRMVAGMSGILLILTLFFFVTLPRFGTGYLGDLWASGAAMTGFSDRMALGEVAAIKKNNATAMRVRVDRPDLLKRRALYWRGIALDHFDGRKWERDRTNAVLLRPGGGGYFIDNKGGSAGPLIRQEILLEPTGFTTLFFLGRPLSFTGTLRTLLRDSQGNLHAAFPFPFQISYEVVSDMSNAPKHDLPGENFLQLPHLDPRIGQLSRRITEGIEGQTQRAQALEGYLRENYRYSLEGLPVGSDPLALFLFQVGQGDCEYFSSALAIMLRQVGIPSRVVNGYLGGEWNAYGDYYLVLQSHAHSWVEAYFDGIGWVTLDSTPAGPAGRPFSFLAPLSDFVDFLRLRWYRYVINFGLQDQYSLFTGLTRPRSWLNPMFPNFSARGTFKQLLTSPQKWIGAGLLVLFIAAVCLSYHLRRKRSDARFMPSARSRATQRYGRFLTLAKKRGLKKKPGETPDEFIRTASKLGEDLVGEFTELYQKARFCGPNPSEAELQRMDHILTELRR